MFALECAVNEANKIAYFSGREVSRLMIGFYNRQSSNVLTGSVAAIASVETVLRTQPKLKKPRFQCLDTSHGFHSSLVEPILIDPIRRFAVPYMETAASRYTPVHRTQRPDFSTQHSTRASQCSSTPLYTLLRMRWVHACGPSINSIHLLFP